MPDMPATPDVAKEYKTFELLYHPEERSEDSIAEPSIPRIITSATRIEDPNDADVAVGIVIVTSEKAKERAIASRAEAMEQARALLESFTEVVAGVYGQDTVLRIAIAKLRDAQLPL